jgi:hypothetical protein
MNPISIFLLKIKISLDINNHIVTICLENSQETHIDKEIIDLCKKSYNNYDEFMICVTEKYLENISKTSIFNNILMLTEDKNKFIDLVKINILSSIKQQILFKEYYQENTNNTICDEVYLEYE